MWQRPADCLKLDQEKKALFWGQVGMRTTSIFLCSILGRRMILDFCPNGCERSWRVVCESKDIAKDFELFLSFCVMQGWKVQFGVIDGGLLWLEQFWNLPGEKNTNSNTTIERNKCKQPDIFKVVLQISVFLWTTFSGFKPGRCRTLLLFNV